MTDTANSGPVLPPWERTDDKANGCRGTTTLNGRALMDVSRPAMIPTSVLTIYLRSQMLTPPTLDYRDVAINLNEERVDINVEFVRENDENMQRSIMDSDTVDASRKPRPSLPKLPKGLSWPEKDFDESSHFQKHGGIVRYLDEEWRSLIETRWANMGVLRRAYPMAARGIDTLKRRGGKLPPDLDVPQVSPGSGRRAAASPKCMLG